MSPLYYRVPALSSSADWFDCTGHVRIRVGTSARGTGCGKLGFRSGESCGSVLHVTLAAGPCVPGTVLRLWGMQRFSEGAGQTGGVYVE